MAAASGGSGVFHWAEIGCRSIAPLARLLGHRKSFTLVPPLTNLSANDAVSKLGLDSLGFQLAYDYYSSPPQKDANEGKVTRSDPASAALVARGTPVKIFVHTFSPPCTPQTCRVFNPAEIAILMQSHTKSMKTVKMP